MDISILVNSHYMFTGGLIQLRTKAESTYSFCSQHSYCMQMSHIQLVDTTLVILWDKNIYIYTCIRSCVIISIADDM